MLEPAGASSMPGDEMLEIKQIKLPSGLQFTTSVAGPADGQVVILLQGFPESRLIWDVAIAALARAGYRAVAPDQRGYSPGARPDPADCSNYAFDKLVADAIDLADHCGAKGKRFHLVGHDWGGSVAWGISDRHPDRLASLTLLSRPHPASFLRAYQDSDGVQKALSRHHTAFLNPETTRLLLENDALRLRRLFSAHRVPEVEIERQLGVIGNPQALEAALAWYRCNTTRPQMGKTRVPTLYIWGDADGTIGPKAAYGTREFVDAEFRMEVLPGVGHFVMDQAPNRASELILQQVAGHRASQAA